MFKKKNELKIFLCLTMKCLKCLNHSRHELWPLLSNGSKRAHTGHQVDAKINKISITSKIITGTKRNLTR